MTDPISSWEQEMLATVRKQQDAYLEAMAAWRRAMDPKSAGAAPTPSAAPTMPAMPTPPAAPTMPAMPTPSEVADAQRAFIEAMFKQQQQFLDRLGQILSPDSPTS